MHQPAKVETLNARAGQENFPVALRVLPRDVRTAARAQRAPRDRPVTASRASQPVTAPGVRPGGAGSGAAAAPRIDRT